MPVPSRPKIYHIVHVDNLASIVADGALVCDAAMAARADPGTTIGMSNIKRRRLCELRLQSHPDLHVGDCTPFYFCSRSVMLYLIYVRSRELEYKGGQEPIIHLEADLRDVVAWAEENGRRWAFTLSNAGAYYFEDRVNLAQLDQINWASVGARQWAGAAKEGKQAEFLIEESLPWSLVERIGVFSNAWVQPVNAALGQAGHRPRIEIRRDWYYGGQA
ncbi:type II toxin-antitoxin system toxin DNA ADP-ribosyl transferase DarT [Limimaricola soesokkakensis]|uniref:type II toxin-antitoxin system toxin DNA ADP-ribosyl transferase DarT n=1 Tax=Limimaricola soesokkakensis TaxID=1343159 RepID=UPI0035171089